MSDLNARNNEKALEAATCALALVHKKRLTALEADALTKETLSLWKAHVNEGFLRYRKSMGDGEAGAQLDWADAGPPGGCWIANAHGKLYLDCLSGFGVFNVGHRHPVVIAAIQAQLQKQALHSQEFLDPLRAQAARLLASITPGAGALSHSFFVNSGAEAVEAAIKLSMAHTGRGRLLSCLNGFHGKTLGALAATSKALFRAPFTRALMDVVHVPFNDVPALTAAFAAANFTGNKFCALLIEPIQGEGGIHVAKTEFLKAARELCTREGTCLVLDEVQTGMGRTSAMFACEHFDVVPDLLCVGKSLSGGVFPVAACCGGEHVWAKYVESPFLFTTTFGGSPLACAAAISTIHVLLKDRLVDAARERGQQLSRGLQGLMQDFPDVIKDVRGLGLMLGVELQSNEIGIAWSSALLRNNVLVSGTLIHATTVRVCPPLTITPEEVCIALEAMRCACESVRRTIIFGRPPVAKL